MMSIFGNNVQLIIKNKGASVRVIYDGPRYDGDYTATAIDRRSFEEAANNPERPRYFVVVSDAPYIVNCNAFDLTRIEETRIYSAELRKEIPHVRLRTGTGIAKVVPVTLASFMKDLKKAGIEIPVRPQHVERQMAAAVPGGR